MYDDQEFNDPYDLYGDQENEPGEQQNAYHPGDSSYETMREPYQGEPEPWVDRREVISTSQAVNLTCALSSISVLLALFLCFADQRSRAVRRFAIQSVGFGVVHLAAFAVCWLVDMLLGWVPLLGPSLHVMLVVIMIAISLLFYALRVVMMFHAYRGEAYALPVFGESLRRFE